MPDTPFSGSSLEVWCPLIPDEKLPELKGNSFELEKIAQYFDDWRASMGSKGLVGADLGVLLDRVRMLMINVGIACGQKRDVALKVQAILSTTLRNKAIELITRLYENDIPVKKSLMRFFIQIKFTRDIDPHEEISKMPASIFTQSGSDESTTLGETGAADAIKEIIDGARLAPSANNIHLH